MKVVFWGTPDFAVPTLAALLADPEIQVQAVVSQPDRRRGRGSKLIPSPVKQLALQHDLPVWQPERVKRCPETLQKLRDCGADFFVVVAYGQLLSAEILAMPRLGCINVHGSLLPKYRGAAPLQWAIANGEWETGITTMMMDIGMDTGTMLLKATTPITLLDNLQTLGDRLASMGAELLIQTLHQMTENRLTPVPQTEAEATYAPLLSKADFQVDWHRSAVNIHNQIRGFYPLCYTQWRDQPLKIMGTIPLGEKYVQNLPENCQPLINICQASNFPEGKAGEIVALIKNWGPVIQAGEDYLLLQTVQPPGKRPQSGWDFVNGTHLKVGEILVNF
ncbi:MAG: methionyl-tRNA formyltransferase [Synechocystis sp.]|nr:methionyl-tRNA formyltransferase [Synechocystis sp.]